MAASVADTVKQSAAEIATTVKTTDWRAELGAFGKDVLDETEELGQSAVAAVEQAIDNVEQLPQHVRITILCGIARTACKPYAATACVSAACEALCWHGIRPRKRVRQRSVTDA